MPAQSQPNYTRAPIEVGQKIHGPGKMALTKHLKDAVEDLFDSYKHSRSTLLDIDYKVEDDGRHMQLHIFPRVPDHNHFYPNNQAFAGMLEKAVEAILGRGVRVSAEFHEEDGQHIRFGETKGGELTTTPVPADTRVTAYLRKESGELTQIVHSKKVPMVWLRIDPRSILMPVNQALELLVETIVQNSERLLRKI